jgi:hypothetical protein
MTMSEMEACAEEVSFMRIKHWQDSASLLLGVWLILSPFALGFAAAATWMTVVFWAAGYHVCRGGVYRSVLFGGVGRASPRAGFAHGTLGGWLRAGVGDGEQCDIRSAGDPVRSLGTGDGSRVYYEVARSLASSSDLRTDAAESLNGWRGARALAGRRCER